MRWLEVCLLTCEVEQVESGVCCGQHHGQSQQAGTLTLKRLQQLLHLFFGGFFSVIICI